MPKLKCRAASRLYLRGEEKSVANPYERIERFLIKTTALLCLLHTLYLVLKHEFGW
jgi:hypothetical protein